MAAHRLAFSCLDGRVVLAQLVLTGVEGLDDRVELLLRRLVALEVRRQLVAERDHPEDLASTLEVGFGGVELGHGAPQLGQRAGHPGLGVTALAALGAGQCLRRPVEHAVGDARAGDDLPLAHTRDVGDLVLEGGAVRVLRRQLLGEGDGLGAQLVAGPSRRAAPCLSTWSSVMTGTAAGGASTRSVPDEDGVAVTVGGGQRLAQVRARTFLSLPLPGGAAWAHVLLLRP